MLARHARAAPSSNASASRARSCLRTVEPPTRLRARQARPRRRAPRQAHRHRRSTDDLYLVLHLMIAGRLRWREPGAKLPGRLGLAAFDFVARQPCSSPKPARRSAPRCTSCGVRGARRARAGRTRGAGRRPRRRSARRSRRERHTLKRTLTDPRLLSGIGNAYSDEILHRARLSPGPSERPARRRRGRAPLRRMPRRRSANGPTACAPRPATAFPKRSPPSAPRWPCTVAIACPARTAATPVQRIVHAENETNYCARCQTGGKLLADRALSRLLHDDWPRTIDELEDGAPRAGPAPLTRPRLSRVVSVG